jgi:aspartyl-tRNA(Asn)/glutamyl-tRNA(Gln) amidotransferase subunit A
MPVPDELAFAPVRTLGNKLRAREFSSRELTEFFLKRLETIGPRLNAVVTVTREHALKAAEAADRELAAGKDRGPLHGIPFGIKDLLATKGIPTTWGAAPFKEQMLDVDATVVVRLRDAGAVLAAKLAMVELAGGMGYEQANASFTGPGLNPWDSKRWCGGSSSGPGAAVGGGLVPFAIGSETWGSIMVPSSFCGIAGLRPTYGRVSRFGAMALSWTMDRLGPMCRTADDCGLVLNAIAGADGNDPSSAPVEYRYPPSSAVQPPFRLATLRGAVDRVQPEVRANFERSLTELQQFATVTQTELPAGMPFEAVASTIISCETAAAFGGLVSTGDVWELTAEEDRRGAHAALMIPAADYINAQRIRAHIQRAMDELLSQFDAIVTPTQATVAWHLDRPFAASQAGFSASRIGGAGNAAGVPALTVPNGFGEAHLPTGLQFVGRAFEENRLIAIANEYQKATHWHTLRPPGF